MSHPPTGSCLSLDRVMPFLAFQNKYVATGCLNVKFITVEAVKFFSRKSQCFSWAKSHKKIHRFTDTSSVY